MRKLFLCAVLAVLCVWALGMNALANPLLGHWNVVSVKASDLMTQLSIDRYKSLQPKEISFEEKEMGVVAHEAKENKVPVQYKEVSEKIWAFSIDEGKSWNEVVIEDADTLIRKEKKELDVEIVYTLKRKAEGTN